jgi:hypothetical protein
VWPPGVSDSALCADLVALWEYFRPDYAIGDAYGVGMLTACNDTLYKQGLTHINRETVNDGQSNATSWNEWAFAPMRFDGMTKHVMASAVREIFHHNRAAYPFVDMMDETEPPEWLAFVRQVGNIKAEPTKASFTSFKMADPKTGDDLFDATCAAVYALITRGLADAPTTIQHRRVSREQLLGLPGGAGALVRAIALPAANGIWRIAA